MPTKMSGLLNDFAMKLQSYLQPERESHQNLVQKGLLLYRQHLVYGKRVSGRFLTGKVQDVSPVECRLDLENPLDCECSCPQDGFCRHQLALFFSAYSEENSVFDWVQQWKSRSAAGQILQSVKRASELLKQKKDAYSQPSITQWLADFHAAFQEINNRHEYLMDISARQVYHRLTGFLPVEQEWEPLYRLIAAYEMFKYLNRICRENEFFSSASLLRFFVEEAEDSLVRLSSGSIPFAYDPFIGYLRDDCWWLADGESVYEFDSVDFYRMLWSRLLKNANWRKQEAERLRAKIVNGIDTGEKLSSAAVLCFIHQAFLSGNDDTALNTLEQLANSGMMTAVYIPYWLAELNMHHSEGRLYRYISASLPMVSAFLQTCRDAYDRLSYMRLYFRSVDEKALAEHQPRLLEKLYRTFLPSSSAKYGDHLFSKERYHKWVELQLLIGNQIEDIEKEKLNLIAKQEPEALLPLYHRAVNACIAEKNRSSYKKAVRYLKKLRAVYRKKKEEDKWDSFFYVLTQQTKRLRAFQEECRKGKLTDADGI
ncbi:SWIM zinc finger family protein [Weizmannia acidilactici]|nr:SWIM zinc finger family protein [Weizmannia acidilactici]